MKRALILLPLLLSLSACVHAQVKQQFGGVGTIGGVTGIQSNVTPQLQIVTTSCAPGVLTQAYQCQLQANFGVLPLSWSVFSGSLPNGLTLDGPSGLISGIPGNNPGTTAFTVRVTDSASTPQTANQNISITIACSQILVTTPLNLPAATQGTPYSQGLTEAGGMSAFTWSLVAGSTLPPGESLSGASITGTPMLAGNYSFQLKVTDSCTTGAQSVISTFTEQVNSNIAVTTASLPSGTVGQNYSQTLSVAGGTGPYVWTLSSGTLPAGLSLSSAGAITGAPTAVGTSQFTVKVTDSLSNFATANLSISTACTPLQITSPGTICAGTQGQPYSCQMTESGGFGSDTWSSTGLSACALSINGAGLITGTPSCVGSFTPLISVIDSCPVQQPQSGIFNIPVAQPNPLTIITPTTLPGATVGTAYGPLQFQATGGVTPYVWGLSGAIPGGMTFAANGTLSGTPTTSGAFPPTVTVTDARNVSTPGSFSLASVCTALVFSAPTLPQGTQNQAYSFSFVATGGATPLTWSETGTLPTGLTLSSAGVLSGTPTNTGIFPITVQVRDACLPSAQIIQQNVSLTIAANSGALTISSTDPLPGATESVAYSNQLVAIGGTQPYTWSLLSGSLPAGLSLSSAGVISGTPTATGTASFTVKVTDNIAGTQTKALHITVSCVALALVSTSPLPGATQTHPYSFQFQKSGGTGAVTWGATGVPAGLSLSSAGVLSGTPTNTGVFTITVTATDSCSPTPQTTSAPFSLTIVAPIAPLVITTVNPLQSPIAGVPFSQQMAAQGGVLGYSWALIGGSFPAGISMNAAGLISGTATQAVSVSPQIQVTDSQPLTANTIFVMTSSCPVLTLTPVNNTVLAAGTQGSSYSAQTKGIGGYSTLSYSATGLPTGLTIGLSTGLISGTPSVAGNFTPAVTVTDSCSPTPQTITNNYTLTINSNLAVTTATLPNGVTGTVYSATESAAGGTPAYAFTVTAGALPTGLALSSAGAITGTPTVIGNFTFTVTVTDSLLATATQQYTVTISGSAAGCGTNASGTPTNNKQCGTAGTNVYTGEGSATNFNQWCATPGTSCFAITSCNPTLTSGTPTSHRKYYLPADLNCGPASLAFFMTKYTDVNLNGHTLTGVIFRNGGMRGLHVFNGVLNCSLTTVPTQVLANQFAYACLDDENNGGTYITSAGGGDEIRVHHISGLQSATTPNPTTGALPFFMRFTGDVLPPTGGWTEPALVIYNDNFASVPETTNSRQHAGVYAETQPIEYYNNTGNVGASGQATAAQLLEVYGPHSNGTFPNYVHNNFLTCAPYTVVGGDTCRPVLCDGATFCHVAFNDIWPNNNRGVRLRDASSATVDHNFFHQLTTGAGFTGACLQTGGNDVNSGMGQVVTQTSSNNTCELGANTLGVTESGQQGFTSDADTFTCAAAGCAGAVIAKVDYSNGGQGLLPGTVVINSGAFTLTDAGSSFRTGTSFFTGSVVTFTGFANGANNYPNFFTATAAAATVLTFGAQTLVSESATGIHFIAKNAISFNNYVLGAGVTSNVTVSNQAAGVNSTSLTWCNGTAPVNTNVGATAGQIIHNTGACP